MAQDLENVSGGAALHKALQDLPVRIEKRLLSEALNEGARIIERAMVARVPVQDGALLDSIEILEPRTRRGRVNVKLRAGGAKARHAHLVEFGTKPHDIKPKGGISLFFAGLFRTLIKHPGAKPKPFVRPAFDATAPQAISAISTSLGTGVERIAKER